MLARLIEAAIRRRLLVLLGAVAVAVWGANAYLRLPIDAFPDVSPTQVMVSMRAPGLTPEELEARVTVPIEQAMKGNPRALAELIKLYSNAVPNEMSQVVPELRDEDLTATDLATLGEGFTATDGPSPFWRVLRAQAQLVDSAGDS